MSSALDSWKSAIEAPVDVLKTPTMALKGRYPREYDAWSGARDRCLCDSDKDYQWYGAKGIGICKRWDGEGGFQRFVADMGRKPEGAFLARKNVARDFTPSNCFWGTRLDITNNRSHQRMVTLDGRTQSAARWAREAGLPRRQIVTNRLNRGWHPRAAVFGKDGETHEAAHKRLGVKSRRKS